MCKIRRPVKILTWGNMMWLNLSRAQKYFIEASAWEWILSLWMDQRSSIIWGIRREAKSKDCCSATTNDLYGNSQALILFPWVHTLLLFYCPPGSKDKKSLFLPLAEQLQICNIQLATFLSQLTLIGYSGFLLNIPLLFLSHCGIGSCVY